MRTFTEIHKEIRESYMQSRGSANDTELIAESAQELLNLATKVHNDEANVEISLNNAKKRRAI